MGVEVLLCSVTLLAVTTSAPVVLTERAFLDAVARDERIIAVLDEPLAIARAERDRRSRPSNPTAAFEREDPGSGTRQDTWSLSWAPPLDGRLGQQARSGREGLRAAEQRHAQSRIESRAEWREAYAAWALAREGAALAERLAGLVDRLARRAEVHASRGETSPLTARRLRLARIEMQAEAARRRAESVHARARIRVLSPSSSDEVVPERPLLPPVPTDSANHATPRIAALEHELRRAEASQRATARSWSLPEFTFGLQELRDETERSTGTVVGVSWDLPLLDRSQGDRLEARARVTAARARLELDRERDRQERMAAIEAYETLRAAAVLAEDGEAVAERVLTSAAAMFEAGESDVTDLLETLRGVLAGQQAALGAHEAALRAHRELEIRMGRALPLTEGEAR